MIVCMRGGTEPCLKGALVRNDFEFLPFQSIRRILVIVATFECESTFS